MADTYIDPYETVIYGTIACEEMRKRLLGLHPDWDPGVRRAIALQAEANGRMQSLIAGLDTPKVDKDELETIKDTIVRFGAWMDSLKGRPLDRDLFFNGAPPSAVARRRLQKLSPHIGQMVEFLTPYVGTIDGADGWVTELRDAHAMAERNRIAQTQTRVTRKQLSPALEAERRSWLDTYVANKRWVEGVLRHEKLLYLMPFIFDDLAEVQRTGRAETDVDENEGEDALVTGPELEEGGDDKGEGGGSSAG